MKDEEDELKPKGGTDTVVSNEDISTYNKEICVTNYEIYNVDNVVIRHERGGDTVDAHKDTLSGIKDDIKLEASGAMDGVMLKIPWSFMKTFQPTTRRSA